jgi:serine/threonine-protein kinase
MKFWAELKKRRVFPWFGAYIAGGFLVLEGFDQLVGQGLLPGVAYKLALVFYLFGFPGTLILAWFHGEKGTQKPSAIEIWMQGMLLAAALAVGVVIFRNDMAARAVAEAAAESGLDPRRVAVLYFEDFSTDGELGYLADGLTEGLIDRLSQVRALDVISRNGVAPYRGSDVRRDSIALALEAGSLIDGSVERVGERVRITARLVDGASAADIQRESFELPAGDLLIVSDSLSLEVAELLRERLGEEVRLRERRAATSSADAWALVQRAERSRKDAETLLGHDDLDAAFEAFARADSLLALGEAADPGWVEPIVLRSRIAYRRARLAEDDDAFAEWTAVGLGHADRALQLAPSDPPALEIRGTLRYASWVFQRPADPEAASRLLESARTDLVDATQADPTLAWAHSTLGHLYYQTEDIPAAVLSARRAYEEDAYLDLAHEILWRLYGGSLDLEQFTQASRWCMEGAKRFPDNHRFAYCQIKLMATPAEAPDVDRAWELAASVDSLAPEQRRAYERAQALINVAGVIARAGLADSARSVLTRAGAMVNSEIDPTQFLVSQQAYVRTLLGDYDEAVALLKRYAAANPGHYEHGAVTSWWWRDLQSHPGFQELIGR